MIRRTAVVLAFLVAVAAAGPCGAEAKRVLFIGNSYTYTNDLPRLVERIAKSKGISVRTEAVSVGSATLKDHWDSGRAAEALRKSRFDFVVLQPQSSEELRMPEETAAYAKKLADAIRSAGAEAILFAPWHPLEFDPASARFRSGYRNLAAAAQLRLAPVDAAWESARSAGAQLYNEDQRHPNLAGSYLAACVFVSVLTGADPSGAWHPDGISDAAARDLQRAAWEAVQAEPARR